MKRSMHISPELQRFVGKTVPKKLDRNLKQASYLANRSHVEARMAMDWREFQELLFAAECQCPTCILRRALIADQRNSALEYLARHAKPVGSA